MSEMIKFCPDTRIYLKDIFFYKFDLLVVLSFLPRFVLHLFKEKFFPHNGLAAEFRKAVGETYLHLLKKNIDDKTIAFFYPTEALRDHFDRIPNLLAQNKIKTINLYGTAKNDDLERQKNSFYVGAPQNFFSLQQLTFIQYFVTSSVVDCFPPKSTKILIDHLSYATFRPVSMDEEPSILDHDHIIKKYEYFFKFIVLYDHIFSPNKLRDKLTSEMFEIHGYSKLGEKIEPQKASVFMTTELLRNGQMIRKEVVVHPLGYPKLDRDYSDCTTEKLIIYAPTHLDNANRESWENFTSSNTHGSEIIRQLCSQFPQYKIMYKPYIREDSTIVAEICAAGSEFDNFLFDQTSKNESLYKKAQLLVSDFSSTAFTFSITTQRPVVFFSKNEGLLRNNSSDYLGERHKFGFVVHNCKEMVRAVEDILSGKQNHRQNILKAIKEKQHNYMTANEAIASALIDIVTKQPLEKCEVYQRSWLIDGSRLWIES